MPLSKEKRALYYRANKERLNKENKAYYAKNRDKILKQKKDSYNPEKRKRSAEASKKYRKSNREKLRLFYADRYKKHRLILKQVHFEEKNKRLLEIIWKGLALERRRKWKILKSDLWKCGSLKIAA